MPPLFSAKRERRVLQPSSHRRHDDAQLVHQARELVGIERLRTGRAPSMQPAGCTLVAISGETRSATPFTFAVGTRSLWVLGPKSIFRVDPRTNRIADSARIGKHAGSDYRGLRSIAVVGHSLWVTDGDADTVDRIDIAKD